MLPGFRQRRRVPRHTAGRPPEQAGGPPAWPPGWRRLGPPETPGTVDLEATRGPTGLPRPKLPDALEAELTAPVEWRPVEPELADDPIADVQRRLLASTLAARYPSLRVTGILDGATRAALADFQHRVGIAVTGTIDRATEVALGVVQGLPGLPGPARPRIQLSRGLLAVITGIGMLLTVLMLIDGWGFVSGSARDIVAIVIAALTPLVVYFLPNWKPPGGG